MHGVGLLWLAWIAGAGPAGKEVPFGAGSWLGLGPFGAAAPRHNTGSCGGKVGAGGVGSLLQAAVARGNDINKAAWGLQAASCF